MKLPFFKKNAIVSLQTEAQKVNLDTQIAERLYDELKTTSGNIYLLYSFTSEHGRNGGKFAAKLAEQGDEVSYSVNNKKKYVIAGKSNALQPNQQEIKEYLLTKVDLGALYNCVLKEWNIFNIL